MADDMQNDAWFRFFPTDWDGDTRDLFNEEVGAYLRLVLAYYKIGPLPKDEERLRQIACVKERDWLRTWGTLQRFFRNGDADGLLHQKRCDEEIAWRTQEAVNKRAASKLGVLKRREIGQLPAVQPDVQPSVHGNATVGSIVGSTVGEPAGEQNQNQNQNHNPEPCISAHSRFEKPSLEAIKLQAAKSGLPDVEAEKFFDHYEANGWVVGKTPMKSWPAAMRTWKRNFDERRYANTNTAKPGHAGTGRPDRNVGTLNEKRGDYSKLVLRGPVA